MVADHKKNLLKEAPRERCDIDEKEPEKPVPKERTGFGMGSFGESGFSKGRAS